MRDICHDDSACVVGAGESEPARRHPYSKVELHRAACDGRPRHGRRRTNRRLQPDALSPRLHLSATVHRALCGRIPRHRHRGSSPTRPTRLHRYTNRPFGHQRRYIRIVSESEGCRRVGRVGEDPREDVGVDVVECGLNTANSHRPTRDTCSTVESRRVGSCEELNRRQSAGVGTHSKQYYPVCAARHSGVAP